MVMLLPPVKCIMVISFNSILHHRIWHNLKWVAIVSKQRQKHYSTLRLSAPYFVHFSNSCQWNIMAEWNTYMNMENQNHQNWQVRIDSRAYLTWKRHMVLAHAMPVCWSSIIRWVCLLWTIMSDILVASFCGWRKRGRS